MTPDAADTRAIARSSTRDGDPVLEVSDLTRHFRVPEGVVSAVEGVNFTITVGETLGLVGESGCGKSTTARTILQLPPPTSGRVVLRGQELTALSGGALRRARSRAQMVFQDPYDSLDPRWSLRALVAEPLRIQRHANREQRRRRADELLDLVGLDPAQVGDRRIRQLSGGQAQRVGIARALAADPALILCDEAVSGLDVSVQAQVLNLFAHLKRELGLTYLFISHDLAVVRHVSDRIGVMYLGRLVELASAQTLYRRPAHPYTQALLSAVPRPDPGRADQPERIRLPGDVPSPLNPPSGCRFRTRCPRAQQRCATHTPPLREVAPNQHVACHYPLVGEPDEGQSART